MNISIVALCFLLCGAQSAKAETFSWEELQRNRICSKDFCQTPDDGVTFRNECRHQDAVLGGLVWVIRRFDGNCYCPCTFEYRTYRGQ